MRSHRKRSKACAGPDMSLIWGQSGFFHHRTRVGPVLGRGKCRVMSVGFGLRGQRMVSPAGSGAMMPSVVMQLCA